MHVELRTLCDAPKKVEANIGTRICKQVLITSTSKPRDSPTRFMCNPVSLCLSNERLLILLEGGEGASSLYNSLRKLGSRSELILAYGPVRGVVAMQ